MRTQHISRPRPVLRRSDEAVIAWIFRLMLDEAGQSAFDDITVEVPMVDYRPLKQWGRGFLEAMLEREATAPHRPHPADPGRRCVGCQVRLLHGRLDARLHLVQLDDFDPETLAP